MLFEELKRGLEVFYNGQKYTVVQFSKNDDGSVRVEIIQGETNPFFVWLTRLTTEGGTTI